MHSPRPHKWLFVCGTLLCIVGVALAFYGESLGGAYQLKLWAENWRAWFVLAGLVALLATAVIWGFQTTVRNSLLAALASAVTGALLAVFGRINIHGATATRTYRYLAPA